MTADRTETKYLVSLKLAGTLAREIARHLKPHRFRGPGAAPARGRLAYATTIYFDTAERDLYRAALARAVHLKLRAREYYSVGGHGENERLLTPRVWLEIKHRDGAHSWKRRIAIDKRDLARFLEAECSAAGPTAPIESADVLAEVARIGRIYPTPLRPSCLVNYCRSAWQDAAGSLRVTIDREVAFFAPPADPFARDACLTREALGHPQGSLSSAVVEIKLRGALPAWLEGLLAELHLAPESFSKFVAASRAVHD